VFYLLDNPPKEWVGNTGYVTEELLKAALPKEGNVKIFVCGYVSEFLVWQLIDRPPPMYKAVSGMKKSPSDQGELSGILQKLGYDKEQVHLFVCGRHLIVGLQVLI
jgi:cytochrome-b5 reductase